MNARSATVVLFALLATLLAGIEGFARLGFGRVSRMQHETEAAWATGATLGRAGTGDLPTVLLAGNSLLEKGLAGADLGALGDGRYEFHELIMRNTQAIDWEFGLRRLVREGSRPASVVLVLGPRHLWGNRLNVPYFARYMLATPDWALAQRAAGLGNTARAELLLANLSAWLGARAEIRNALLEKTVPGSATLAHAFRPAPRSPAAAGDGSSAEGTVAIVQQILRINGVVAGRGSHFALLIMPEAEGNGLAAAVARLRAAGVSVFNTSDCYAFGPEDFSDGFHLNTVGAAKFRSVFSGLVEAGWFSEAGAGRSSAATECPLP